MRIAASGTNTNSCFEHLKIRFSNLFRISDLVLRILLRLRRARLSVPNFPSCPGGGVYTEPVEVWPKKTSKKYSKLLHFYSKLVHFY